MMPFTSLRSDLTARPGLKGAGNQPNQTQPPHPQTGGFNFSLMIRQHLWSRSTVQNSSSSADPALKKHLRNSAASVTVIHPN